MITRRDYVKVNEKKSQFAALNDFNKSSDGHLKAPIEILNVQFLKQAHL